MKRHRLERQDSFAGLIHRLNLFLKPARGAGGPELTVGIYDDIYRIGNPRCHTNGGDKGSCLKFAADADSVGLAIDTRVTNIDIVIARGKAAAGASARCRVIAAGVAKERIKPIGRVVAAGGGVVQERLITVGRVADPLIWFSESGFIGVYPWPEFFPGLEPINQPQIDTDFWSLPAASGRVHIIDGVCQRCGAGEHKRPLPVDSR